MKSHPIVRILGMALILSTLVSLVSWGGSPTTPGARASDLQPPHTLDVESYRSRQTAVVHALPQQYVAHEPIHITKNAEFAALGFPGEGSPSNPYVIEGLNISQIIIKDTTAYFHIRNNYVEGNGISLRSVSHGTIDSNIVTNCWDGIKLYDSEQITVAHNTVSQCEWAGITFCKSGKSTVAYNTISNCNGQGINLLISEQNIISHNTISVCGVGITLNSEDSFLEDFGPGQNTVAHNTVVECEAGITLAYSDQNIISNNTVSNCRKGIYLIDTKQNTLVGNQLVNNYLVVELYLLHRGYGKELYIWPVEHYLQATVAENVVNGRPLAFWQNERGGTVPPGVGQIFLLNCTGVEVTGQALARVPTGVFAAFCSHVTIHHNTVSECDEDGIALYKSVHSTVAHNSISQCGTGIKLDTSDQNTLDNNTVSQCEDGIVLTSTSGQNTLVRNQLVNNSNNSLVIINIYSHGWYGPYVQPVEDYVQATVAENVVNGRPLAFWQNERGGTVPPGVGQIFLLNCTGVEVTGQDLARVPTGVFAAFCSHLAIHHNTFSNNSQYGIHVHVSGNSTIANNTISECGVGIRLFDSENITLAHNTITQNSDAGISFQGAYTYSSKKNTVVYNTVANNTGHGLGLGRFSSENTVKWNDFLGNHPGGGQAGDAGSNNVFARNYWDDHDNTDRNGDGIADAPYAIGGNQDSYPLTVLVNSSHSLSSPTFTYPNGGEMLQGTVTLHWTPTTDTWEHSVTYTVSYSADDGHTWIPLASGLSTSEYEWNTTTVADGSAYRIQVVATCSEGLTVEDVSDAPFTIQNPVATTTSFPPVGAFPIPRMPVAMLLVTLLLFLAMHAVRRGKRKVR